LATSPQTPTTCTEANRHETRRPKGRTAKSYLAALGKSDGHKIALAGLLLAGTSVSNEWNATKLGWDT